MSEERYTYAVARVRAKESTLLNKAALEQLLVHVSLALRDPAATALTTALSMIFIPVYMYVVTNLL